MTKQSIYDTIVELTREITSTGIAAELFEAARSDSTGQQAQKVSEKFMKTHSDLYNKMNVFTKEFFEFIDEYDGQIFGLYKNKDEEKGIWIFDPITINASSFFVLTFLKDIDHTYLFLGHYEKINEDTYIGDDDEYLNALEVESKSSYLADFVANETFVEEQLEDYTVDGIAFSNKFHLLSAVLKGKLREYTE